MIQKTTHLLAFCLLLISSCTSSSGQVAPPSNSEGPPNILLILVDDLGYTDIGAYGGDADTPNLDRLASESIVFSNAHSYATCSPTRAALMTGQDPHRVGLGSQNGFAPPGVSLNTPGYAGSLEGQFTGIATMLAGAGYKSYQSGKWHLGYKESNSPKALGFDQNYTLVDGAASYYGDMKTISLDLRPDGRAVYEKNGERLDSLPEDFYATHNFTEEMIAMLDQHDASAPFFAYLAFTAVHDPLHVPEDLIEKYLDRYDGDVIALREARIDRAAAKGVLETADIETRWLPGVPAYEELDDLARQDLRYRMAVYGAMIEHVDTEVGRLVDHLKASGQYENTLILFLSDNGAALQPRTVYSRNEKSIAWQASAYPDNAMTDYGSPRSYPTLGILNAQAVSGPWFAGKASVYEGGTRVPFLVKAPGEPASRISDTFIQVTDIYPTLLDFANLERPDSSALQGDSAKDLILGTSDQIGDDEFGMSAWGTRAYRKGDWKLVFAEPAFGGTGDWALYNLKSDPGETRDVSADYPELTSELILKWFQFADRTGIVISPMELVNAFGELTQPMRASTDWATE